MTWYLHANTTLLFDLYSPSHAAWQQ
jgi:hypothetical protein